MASNLTKAAVLIAMRVAEDEGDRAEWRVLDQLYAAMVTGETLSLAAAAVSLARIDPYDLDHGDPGTDVWTTEDDGRRGA